MKNEDRKTTAKTELYAGEDKGSISKSRASRRRAGKSATAFRTISEVAGELEVQQHVLRFWESKFSQVKPLKRGGGRRYYRPEDVELLKRIHSLLYTEGYTIKGVQKLLQKYPKGIVPATTTENVDGNQSSAVASGNTKQQEIASILDELKGLRGLLEV